jgi:hypothetical protein
MITLTQVTEMLGWASILNIAFLFLVTIMLVTMKSLIVSMHSKMFGIPENELSLIYFKYLANYKTLSLVFIVIPYIALKIMGE